MEFTNDSIDGEVILAQVAQTNPIRFQFLYHLGDGKFEHQGYKFRCKDYFNDIVAAYNGVFFKVYGFENKKIKLNEEGTYVKLSHIVDMAAFITNIGSIKDVPGGEQPLTVEPIDATTALCFIPRAYYSSTYTISLLTYLIRVSNISGVITDWLKHPTVTIDRPMGTEYGKILAQGLQPPKEGYWYYAGKAYNNTTMKETGVDAYTIHNCGAQGMMNALTRGF